MNTPRETETDQEDGEETGTRFPGLRVVRRIAAPLLLVTGSDEVQLADAPAVWRRWAEYVSACEVPGGHFVPEESPAELLAALLEFLG